LPAALGRLRRFQSPFPHGFSRRGLRPAEQFVSSASDARAGSARKGFAAPARGNICALVARLHLGEFRPAIWKRTSRRSLHLEVALQRLRLLFGVVTASYPCGPEG
jgi:hypothetical protein